MVKKGFLFRPAGNLPSRAHKARTYQGTSQIYSLTLLLELKVNSYYSLYFSIAH